MTIQSVGVVAMRRPPHRRANRPCPPACLIKQRSESETQGLTPSDPSQHITSIVRGTLRLCFYSGGPVAPMAAAICCLTCGLQAPAPLEDSTASPKKARRQASGHRQCSSSLLQAPPRRPDPSDGGGHGDDDDMDAKAQLAPLLLPHALVVVGESPRAPWAHRSGAQLRIVSISAGALLLSLCGRACYPQYPLRGHEAWAMA